MTETERNGEYDDWLDSIEADEGYYLECEAGHGWLPPRRVCPDCGSRDLQAEPLPDSGEIATHTTITVATPQFEDDAPYVTAIADFGSVRLTGLLRGVEHDAVETGLRVAPDVGETETTGDRALLLRAR